MRCRAPPDAMQADGVHMLPPGAGRRNDPTAARDYILTLTEVPSGTCLGTASLGFTMIRRPYLSRPK
jgi:hypothetical protein